LGIIDIIKRVHIKESRRKSIQSNIINQRKIEIRKVEMLLKLAIKEMGQLKMNLEIR
jgi:hypothetical protein